MLRYRLRTLLIVLAVGPVVLAFVINGTFVVWNSTGPHTAEYGSVWALPYEDDPPATATNEIE